MPSLLIVMSMRKLLLRLVVEAGALCIAVVVLYFAMQQGRRPLQLFSCAINNDTSVQISNLTHRFRFPTMATNFTVTNTTMEVSLNNINATVAGQQEKSNFEDILPLLQKAATDDKIVIITSINEAWSAPNSLLDLFLQSFRIGNNIDHLLKHLIIVAVDPKAFERCKAVHEHCYQLKVNGVNYSSEKVFMSRDYLELVWAKLNLQQQILEFGYSFLFTDADILWFQNPFKYMAVYSDITTSCDSFNGNSDSLENSPNTGFFYVKSTRKTIKMIRYWRDARKKFPPNHEQFVFDKIKLELTSELKVKIQYLDTSYFGGFCNSGNDLNKICTMHANCCIHLNNKLQNLRNVVAVWKNYTNIPVEDQKRRETFVWQVPGRCL